MLTCHKESPQASVLAALGLTEQALRPDPTPLDDGSAGTATTSTEYEDAQADDDLESMAPIGADLLDVPDEGLTMAAGEPDRAASPQEAPPEYDFPDLAIYEAEDSDPEGHEEAGAGNAPPATRVSSTVGGAPVFPTLEGLELPRPLTPVHVDRAVPRLPGVAGEVIAALVEVTQAPVGLVTQAFLATQAAICHADTVVELPDGRLRPVSVLLATLAGPEERGAEVHERLLAAIHAHPGADVANARGQAEERQDDLLTLLTMLPTRAELIGALRGGARSVAICVSDGIDPRAAKPSASSIWAGALLPELSRGGPITDVTTRGHRTVIHDARLAAHIVIDPDVAASLIGSDHLLGVLLPCAPHPTVGARRWRTPTPDALRVLEQHDLRARAALSRIGSTRRTIRLSPDAVKHYADFHDRVDAAAREEGAFSTIAPLAVRLPEYAARIAALLAVTDDADGTEIGVRHLEVAIDLVEYYAAVARQLRAGLHHARLVLEWIRRNWDHPLISQPDLLSRGPVPTRPKRVLARAIDVLERHGWLVRAPDDQVINGVRREENIYGVRNPDGSWRLGKRRPSSEEER
jgi:hypothetical protein